MGALRAQIVEARHHDDVGFETACRRGHGAAQTEHDDRVPRRLDNLRALVAAHPARHHHALGTDVVEAVGLHGLDRPGNRAGQVLGPGRPRPVRIGQLGETLPREVILLCRGHEALGCTAVRVDPGSERLRAGARTSRRQDRNHGHRREAPGHRAAT
jgi:hypothetical protein